MPSLPLDQAFDEQGKCQLEWHRKLLMLHECLFAGGSRCFQVVVDAGEMGAAVAAPIGARAPSLRLQFSRQRPRAVSLAEGGQRLDLIGKILHHARFPQPDSRSHFGEAVQVRVCGRVVIQGQREEAENRKQILQW